MEYWRISNISNEYDNGQKLSVLLNSNQIKDISVCGRDHSFHYSGCQRTVFVIFEDPIDINIKVNGATSISLT